MVWRWHDLERIDHRAEEMPAGWPGVQRALRSMAVMANSGVIAGLLVGGLGGRLFMRIMAATSDDRVHGTLTDADEPIGRVTIGGTVGLILFGGLFGGFLMMLLYRVLRPWLPAQAWKAGVLVGVISLGAFGGLSEMLNRDNKDFAILSPTPLAAFLVVVGAVFLGVVLVSVYERLDRGMAHLDHVSVGIVAFAPLLLTMLTGVGGPVLLLVTLVAAFGTNLVRWWTSSPIVARAGRVVVGASLVGAVAVAASEIAAITT
jgi:hypothetical protein